MLGRSAGALGRAGGARHAGEHLRRARAWNEALERGAPAAERDRAWTDLRAARATARRSLATAREELELLGGKRW
ncbi:MAG: hypothetical protein KF878_36795 [Planctomycetes bacterium]|nr:hypothetical protein [Planctomycetota bacterium]